MMPIIARLPAAAARLAAATLALVACSSSGPATNIMVDNQYCDSLSSYASRCGLTDACTTASVSACGKASNIYSSSAAQILAACLTDTACADGGSSAVNSGPCIQEGLVKLSPTAAQSKLAQDFCVSCATPLYGQTTAECQTAIFESGDGIDWKLYSDSAVTSADAACVPPLAAGASSDACNVFLGCVDQTISALSPSPAACTGSDGG